MLNGLLRARKTANKDAVGMFYPAYENGLCINVFTLFTNVFLCFLLLPFRVQAQAVTLTVAQAFKVALDLWEIAQEGESRLYYIIYNIRKSVDNLHARAGPLQSPLWARWSYLLMLKFSFSDIVFPCVCR